jgi:hypothetical protein
MTNLQFYHCVQNHEIPAVTCSYLLPDPAMNHSSTLQRDESVLQQRWSSSICAVTSNAGKILSEVNPKNMSEKQTADDRLNVLQF